MEVAKWFAERSARGMLTRAAGAWVLVGLPVIAARIWWSVAAAIAIFVVFVAMYVVAAVRYMHRHRLQSYDRLAYWLGPKARSPPSQARAATWGGRRRGRQPGMQRATARLAAPRE